MFLVSTAMQEEEHSRATQLSYDSESQNCLIKGSFITIILPHTSQALVDKVAVTTW